MNSHGRNWKWIIGVFVANAFLTGCQTLQPGAPHPFTAVFESDDLVYRATMPALPSKAREDVRLVMSGDDNETVPTLSRN